MMWTHSTPISTHETCSSKRRCCCCTAGASKHTTTAMGVRIPEQFLQRAHAASQPRPPVTGVTLWALLAVGSSSSN
jgi:hypothetical protein